MNLLIQKSQPWNCTLKQPCSFSLLNSRMLLVGKCSHLCLIVPGLYQQIQFPPKVNPRYSDESHLVLIPY